jgi:hypothetical protein
VRNLLLARLAELLVQSDPNAVKRAKTISLSEVSKALLFSPYTRREFGLNEWILTASPADRQARPKKTQPAPERPCPQCQNPIQVC